MTILRRASFDLVSVTRGDTGRGTAARFTCVECGARHEQIVRGDQRINPEAIAGRAAAAGWTVDATRKTNVWCPACAGPRRKPTQPKAPPMSAPRDLTNDQRAVIRTALDTHFDDATGGYLDGYSDERIAEEAKCARLHVETIRKAGWGDIRVTPEATAARAAVSALAAEIKAQKELWEVATGCITTMFSDAEAKIAAMKRATA